MIYTRYIVKNFLKIFALTTLSFIAILLVSRLEEIAEFIALGAPLRTAALFITFQIPYILPIAVPVSSLLAAMLVMTRLSDSSELTALRSAGLSIGTLIAPLLFTSIILSLATFYLSSELATSSHLKSRKLVFDITSVNPLILLTKAQGPNLRAAYIQMDPVRQGKKAKDLFIAYHNPTSERINCLLSKKVEMKGEDLLVQDLTMITNFPNSFELAEKKGEEMLLVENQKRLVCHAGDLARLLNKPNWKIANDHLKLSFLRLKKKSLENDLLNAKNDRRKLDIAGKITKCRAEFVRRFAIGIAPLTFTLLGISFGIHIGRKRGRMRIIIVLLLGALAFTCFFAAKAVAAKLLFSTALFVLPHLLIITLSSWMISRTNRGVA